MQFIKSSLFGEEEEEIQTPAEQEQTKPIEQEEPIKASLQFIQTSLDSKVEAPKRQLPSLNEDQLAKAKETPAFLRWMEELKKDIQKNPDQKQASQFDKDRITQAQRQFKGALQDKDIPLVATKSPFATGEAPKDVSQPMNIKDAVKAPAKQKPIVYINVVEKATSIHLHIVKVLSPKKNAYKLYKFDTSNLEETFLLALEFLDFITASTILTWNTPIREIVNKIKILDGNHSYPRWMDGGSTSTIQELFTLNCFDDPTVDSVKPIALSVITKFLSINEAALQTTYELPLAGLIKTIHTKIIKFAELQNAGAAPKAFDFTPYIIRKEPEPTNKQQEVKK